MNTEQQTKFPWNDIGDRAHLATIVERNQLTITTDYSHVKIKAEDGRYFIRVIVFESPSPSRIAQYVDVLSNQQMNLAFSLAGDRADNNFEFAHSLDAEFGVKAEMFIGFVRNSDRLILVCEEKDKPVRYISVLLTDEIKHGLKIFMEFNERNERSA